MVSHSRFPNTAPASPPILGISVRTSIKDFEAAAELSIAVLSTFLTDSEYSDNDLPNSERLDPNFAKALLSPVIQLPVKKDVIPSIKLAALNISTASDRFLTPIITLLSICLQPLRNPWILSIKSLRCRPIPGSPESKPSDNPATKDPIPSPINLITSIPFSILPLRYADFPIRPAT